MRILALELEPTRIRGGQEVSLFDTTRGLAARGHDIELLFVREGNLLPAYRTFCSRVDRVNGYVIDRSRTFRAAVRLLLDALQRGRPAPDVIYLNQYFDTPFGRLLSWRFDRPVVCHLRLTPPDVLCSQYRWGLRGVSRFIANSEETRRGYVAAGLPADRIDTVYNGIEVDDWTSGIPRAEARARLHVSPDSMLVAFVGRLDPSKGIEIAIECLRHLPSDTHLILVGPHLTNASGRDYEAELKALAFAAGVADRVRFAGHMSNVLLVYAAADLLVLPSRAEAFGRVVIEAMAAGLPVVASRVGGLPEILTGEFASHLVPAGDAVALANRIKAFRGWQARDPELGARGRRHVQQRFTLANSVAGVEKSLRKTVDRWRRHPALTTRTESS